jgi:hypothetical protein
MKHVDLSTPDKPLDTQWQILAELELPSDGNRVIDSWLEETLIPLNLDMNFRSRILRSAQDAMARSRGSNSTVIEIGYIHILIIAPLNDQLDRKTWGFFRIEKLEIVGDNKNPSNHSIAFYLYTEG